MTPATSLPDTTPPEHARKSANSDHMVAPTVVVVAAGGGGGGGVGAVAVAAAVAVAKSVVLSREVVQAVCGVYGV